MGKITGIDELQKQLQEFQKAIKSLDGEIGKVSVDPKNPNSAIREMERLIDRKVSRYKNNPLISDVVKGLKEEYKKQIKKMAN